MNTTLLPFCRLLVESIVEYPRDLRVEEKWVGSLSTLVLSANINDHGKLLGLHRRMFDALDEILEASAKRHGIHCRLVLDDPHCGREVPLKRFVPKKHWNHQDDTALRLLVEKVLGNLVDTHKIACLAISHNATGVSVVCDMEEPLRDALAIWLNAAGKTMGRIVYLDIARELQHDRPNAPTPGS